MAELLRVLFVEDSEDDCLLCVDELRQQGFDPRWVRVETESAMREALEDRPWDAVLCDYCMPKFDAPSALELMHQLGEDLPFIIISGTVGEDLAMDAMRAGAHDYLMKDNLKRLGPAIERELREAEVRRERRMVIEKVHHLNRVLRATRNVSRLIVHEKDPQRLIQQACDLLAETRGYTNAWITLVDERRRPQMCAGGCFGEAWEGLSEHLSSGDLPACAAAAIAEQEVVITEERRPCCTECVLREHMGDHKSMTVRLAHRDQLFGVMAVGLPGELAVDSEEKSLFLEVARDVAFALQSIKTEKELASETALTDAAFRALADTFFAFNPKTGQALRWNGAFRRVSGYTDAEIAKLPAPQSYFDTADLRKAAAATQEVLERGIAQVEMDLVTKDGSRIPTEYIATATSIPGESEDEVLLIAIGRETTERKRLQAQVAQSDRLASVGVLAAGVAHEINNPLTYVLYNLQTLTEDLPRLTEAVVRLQHSLGAQTAVDALGETAEVLGTDWLNDIVTRSNDAEDGARRVRDIVKDLKTFSRVDEERSVPVNLSDVIDSAINMVSNEIKYRARLVKEYGEIPTLLANDGKLAQVFLNLLVNATHAIEEGDVKGNEIKVRTRVEGELVVAEVHDTGCGIPESELRRVFEPFFTTKEVGLGSGLGLSICRNIITSIGGEITVESKPGEGTCFFVRLPVAQVLKATKTAAVPAVQRSVRGRFLIIDDEPHVAKALTRMLASEHEVMAVTSGARAKEILDSDQAFDGILCDLMMPDITGMDLHDWLAGRHPVLAGKMIFVTGGVFTPRGKAFLKRVENPRLEKPIDPQNLRAWLRKAVTAK
jgi:PAS domain S-box-containing protein